MPLLAFFGRRCLERRSARLQRFRNAYLNWQEGGKRRRVAIGRLGPREAEGVRAAKEAELPHGVGILPRLPTVRDFLEAYLDWYKAERPITHGKAKSEVRLFIARFGHRPIDTAPDGNGVLQDGPLTKDKVAPETVMAGVPLRRVQIPAGYADYATTEKYYAHLTPEDDDGAVAKLRY